MDEGFLELLRYCIPALGTGAIVYLFFKEHIKNENYRRNFQLKAQLQKDILPIKLQAYERLALFLERISAHHLLKRIPPISPKVSDYKDLLIKSIEQEYEHNLSQQIYVSDSCWRMLSTAKNSYVQLIITFNENGVVSAEEARPLLLDALSKSEISPAKALTFLKQEITTVLK